MKIEIDTASATKDELEHLANMLKSLAGNSGSSISSVKSSSSVQGYVNIFGDDSNSNASLISSSQASSISSSSSQQSVSSSDNSGEIFSLFADTPQLSSVSSKQDQFTTPKKSTGKDILDDDHIELY